jgi:hypothetical protein
VIRFIRKKMPPHVGRGAPIQENFRPKKRRKEIFEDGEPRRGLGLSLIIESYDLGFGGSLSLIL